MKHKIRNTLGAIVLSSVVGFGLAGCGKQEQPKRASTYWIGPQVIQYQDNKGDGKIDNVKIIYCS